MGLFKDDADIYAAASRQPVPTQYFADVTLRDGSVDTITIESWDIDEDDETLQFSSAGGIVAVYHPDAWMKFTVRPR